MSPQNHPPPISGATARLKPWHYAVIGGVSIAALFAVPVVSNLLSKQKPAEVTSAVLAGATATTGEPWHPPDDHIVPVASKPLDTETKPAGNPLVSQQPTPTIMPGSNGPSDMRMFGQRGSPQPPSAPPGDSGSLSGQKVAASDAGSLGSLLKPTETSGFSATRIAKPWATIEQGRVIACTGVTPMTSSLPGFVKAIIPNDVRSVDGTTTLIDRGSTVFGEIGHGLAEGQERLFVLWRSILTPAPDHVRITLNSPAADELGEAGLSGDVNTHLWRKLGGALLLSGIDALLQGAGAGIGSAFSHGNNSNNSSGSSLNFYQFQQQGQGLASSLLQHTVTIPDTLHRDQGLPCSIFAAGDLDFSGVYQLRRGH